MNEFYRTSVEEQETIINVDYFTKEVSCYTSRYSTYSRLFKKLGEPTKTYYTQEKISGANWIIPFTDKKRLDCDNKKKLIHDSHFDTESMIFSNIDLQIRNNSLIATANASYECEQLQEGGMVETTMKTDITRLIHIKYCPMCGRQLHN